MFNFGNEEDTPFGQTNRDIGLEPFKPTPMAEPITPAPVEPPEPLVEPEPPKALKPFGSADASDDTLPKPPSTAVTFDDDNPYDPAAFGPF